MHPKLPFEVGAFRVTPFEQPHPNGVSAFRIEAGGKSLVYATDVEHGGKVDVSMLRKLGGHRPPDPRRTVPLGRVHRRQRRQQEGAGATRAGRRPWRWPSNVAHNQLALFHHDPTRDDAGVRDIEELAQERFPMAVAAREGWTVTL